MTTIFNLGSRRGAGALLVFCSFILSPGLQESGFQDRVVALVWGRPIHVSEIRPSQNETDAKRSTLGTVAYKRWLETQEKDLLSRRIWCELSQRYLLKYGLEPTAEEIKSYTARVGNAALEHCAAPNGESNRLATLSRLKFDQLLYRKYGGRVVTRGSERLPVDARQAYLKDSREQGIVRIVDSTFSGALNTTSEETSARAIQNKEAKTYFEQPWWGADATSQQSDERPRPYVIKTLSEDKQVRIDCSNGDSFVIRKRPDGRWYEELMIPVVGAEVGFKTVVEAASARCSRTPS